MPPVKTSAWPQTADLAAVAGARCGLTAAELTADAGWIAVFSDAHIALLRIVRAREDAMALRARILGFLSRQKEPELADIRIARGPADLDPKMRPHVLSFLSHVWARSA